MIKPSWYVLYSEKYGVFKKNIHNLSETWLNRVFHIHRIAIALKDRGADADPKAVGDEWIRPTTKMIKHRKSHSLQPCYKLVITFLQSALGQSPKYSYERDKLSC